MSGDFKIIQPIKAVLTDKTLKPTERLMLAHLMLSAGETGETIWKHGKLAAAIGISDRQSQRITAKLDEKHYINSIQQGLRRANKYLMPWHEAFTVKDSETTPMSVPEPTPMSHQETTPMSVPIVKESHHQDKENTAVPKATSIQAKPSLNDDDETPTATPTPKAKAKPSGNAEKDSLLQSL